MLRQHGFSLVELVVAIAVMITVTLLAIPAYQSSIGNSQIRTVAESVHAGLQQARMEAIKRNTKVQFSLSTNSSWQLGCVTVTEQCPSVIASKSASEGASSSVTVAADAYRAVFSSFGTRDASTGSGLSVVNISNPNLPSGELKALRVTLAAGGFARVCDPSVVTSGDPRLC